MGIPNKVPNINHPIKVSARLNGLAGRGVSLKITCSKQQNMALPAVRHSPGTGTFLLCATDSRGRAETAGYRANPASRNGSCVSL